MNENLLSAGILVLVVGILLILLSMTGIMAFETAEKTDLSNIEQELTDDGLEFKNHSVGDKVVVSGEIVDKDTNPDNEPYYYKYEIRSGEDTGAFVGYKNLEVGENVTVTLEVEEETTEDGEFEYMVLDQEGEPFSILGLEPVFFTGIIVLIMGAALAVFGVIKGKKGPYGRPSPGRGQPQQQQTQQPQQQQQPPPPQQQQPQQQQTQQPQQQQQQPPPPQQQQPQQPQQQQPSYDLDADDDPRSNTQESPSEEEANTEEE